MKNLVFLFLFISASLIGQETTVTMPSSDYGWHQADTKAWVFDPIDTISAAAAPDTVISGGDTTIFDWPDTLILNAPHNLGTAFMGVIRINMDTIQAFTDLTGTLEIRQAQCSTCPYVTAKTLTLPDVDDILSDTFAVRDIKLQLRLIATAGFGSVRSYITLKPSGISGSW